LWGALDSDSSGSGLPLLRLPVADAYKLYNWNPDALSEDTPPDGNVTPLSPPVEVAKPVKATPLAKPRNQKYRVYVDDDDNISEEDIRYDDDYVSGDATYTNEHVAGGKRGETDGGAGPSITDPNYRGVPSPRPTRKPTRRPPTPRPPTPRPPTPRPPTPRPPTRRPPRPRPTPFPTISSTYEPTGAAVPEPKAPISSPTAAFLPILTPTMTAEPSASPTIPVPYTFTVQMTPFEITLTSMDGRLDGQQLQLFNLFSDKQIEQTWRSRKLESLSEDDAKSLTDDDYVDISFKTVVTSQLLSAPIVGTSSMLEESAESTDPNVAIENESYRQINGDEAVKSMKSSKRAQTPTAAPTVDLDDIVRGRRRTTTTTDRRERQRQWQREFQPQRKRALKGKNKAANEIEPTSILSSSAIPPVEHTLYLQQTKTAFVTLRGKYLLKSRPEIIPTLNELDTAVQITYGSESPDLVTILKDYDLEAFDELHGIDFLHFFYPSTVGGVSSITEGGQNPIQQSRTLSGGAKFGIFLVSAVGAALVSLAIVRVHRGSEDDHYKPKATPFGKKSRCVHFFLFT